MATTRTRPSAQSNAAWPDIGRDYEIERVAKLLNESGCCGVMLLGELGVGKTWVGKRALASLDVDVIPLRATALVADIPMGALGPLLARLPERPTDAISALHLLVQYFDARANRSQIVLEIDDAHHLDDGSAMIIAQLVLGGHVKLLATGRPAPMPHVELMELVNEDYLATVRIEPMDGTTVSTLVHAYFGSQISSQLESAVIGAVGGNPFLLRMLLGELVDTGAVRQSDGVWVLTHADSSAWMGRGAIAHAQARLARLPSQLRSVIETVAVAEPITRVALLELAAEEDVDELHAMDLISVSADPALVSVRQSLFGEAVRRAVPASRRSEIRDQLAGAIDRKTLSNLRLMRTVNLDLACSAPIPARDAVAAAGYAIGAYDGKFALRVIDSVSSAEEQSDETRFELAKLRAQARGLVVGPEAGLTDLEELCRDRLGVSGLLRAYALRAKICLNGTGDSGRADAILAEGCERLDELAGREGQPQARKQLEIGRLFTATWAGRFTESVTELERRYVDAELPLVVRIDVATALTECYLAAGRLGRATEVTQWLRDTVSGRHDIPMAVQRHALETVCNTYVMASDWQSATETLDYVHGRAGRFIVIHGGVVEMSRATVLLVQGRIAEALTRMRGALAASRMFDPSGIRPFILAMTAHAYSLLDDEENAVDYVRAAEYELQKSTAGLHFRAGVELAIGICHLRLESAGGHDRLRDFADRMDKSGLVSFELDALASLGMRGDAGALERLVSQTEGVEGTKARIYRLFAEGQLTEDAQKLMRAAQMARDSSQYLIAALMAASGLRSMSSPKTRQEVLLRNNLRVIFDRCRAKCSGVPDSLFGLDEDAIAEQLTAREREIVQLLVKGMSNRDIAEHLTVSVRTVEGHLYRIYPKLGVTRRTEIPAAVSALVGD